MRMKPKLMINESIKIEKRETISYPPIPENVYQVELLDITMAEKPKYRKPEELEKVLEFQFTLLNGKDKKENLRGRNLWRNFVPTFLYISKKYGKNVLYQIVEAIDGQEMSPERESSLDTKEINALIGKQCRVVVKNKKGDDKIWSNIEAFLPAESQLPSLTKEEKEKATVKNKKVDESVEYEPVESDVVLPYLDEEGEYIDPGKIPF